MAGDDWIQDGAPSVRCLHGDVLERLRELPDASCNLVLTDPPYNIGHAYTHNRKRVTAAWDKVDDYVPWCISWLHTCQKPVSILRRLVRVSCPPGGTVLDCFQGSASTGVAALDEGRSYIGIERDDHYHEVAVRRLREHMAQQRMDI